MIAERAEAMAAAGAATMPVDVGSAFAAEQAALDARGVPTGVATPGTTMPDAELLDVNREVLRWLGCAAAAPRWWCCTRGVVSILQHRPADLSGRAGAGAR